MVFLCTKNYYCGGERLVKISLPHTVLTQNVYLYPYKLTLYVQPRNSQKTRMRMSSRGNERYIDDGLYG